MAIVFIGIGASGCSRPQPAQTISVPTPSSHDATLYPDFPLVFYQGQEALSGRELRFHSLLKAGQPIVVNYWASNCAPCTREMPEFERVYQAYKGKALFFGLDVGRFFPAFGDEEGSKQELRRLGITYPAGTPANMETLTLLGVRALPSTEFITPRGERFRIWVGLLNERKLAELVEALLQSSK